MLVLNIVSLTLSCAMLQPVLAADTDKESPEAKRFNRKKLSQNRQAIESYIRSMRKTVQEKWAPETDANDGLLITKVKVSIDASGHATQCQILKASKSSKEDRSIEQFLRSFSFQPLPTATVKTVDLYLTFMTDGTTNVVEHADSPEARRYYQELCGGWFNPENGILIGERPVSGQYNWGPYMADLHGRIKSAWFPPKGNESKRVVVQFKIGATGAVSDLKIYQPSDSPDANEAALKAIEKASPFLALPPEVLRIREKDSSVPPSAKKNIDVLFSFDYNVFNGSGSGGFRRF